MRLTVSTADDPSEPCLTFRTWVLGVISCVLLSFVNQFFGYRTNQLSISAVCVQIVALPVGRWMARALPATEVRLPFTGWGFSLNPGPFTMKEHVLITILASSGTGGIYAVNILTIVKAFYHRSLNVMAALLLTQTTQVTIFSDCTLEFKKLAFQVYDFYFIFVNLVVRLWMGWIIQKILGGFSLYVVAIESYSSFPFQVYIFLFISHK